MKTNSPELSTPALMKDENSNGRKRTIGGGILAKLGLGGGAASSTGGGIVIGGGQSAASAGLGLALKSNAGLLALTLLGATGAVTSALVFTGNAPKSVQSSKFFAKLGADSATAAERAAAQVREAEMSYSGTEAGGVSSSLQGLADANVGALGALDNVGTEAEPVASADSASTAAPENTVQAPNNDWGAAAAKAAVGSGGAASGRKKFQKAAFKERTSGASTKLALAGPTASPARTGLAAQNGRTTGLAKSRGSGSRNMLASRTQGGSSARGGKGASPSAQLAAHHSKAHANLASPSPGLKSAIMDGSSRSAGAGASTISGAGAGGGDSNPIVNPVTSQNTSSKNPPPPIKKAKDKTPYKKEMKMATIALLAATALLLLASLVSNAEFPQAKAIAKILAGLAIAAAAVATVMGVILATKFNQTMQGGMFAVGGAIIMFQASMVLTKKDAGAEGEAAVDQQKLQAQDEAFKKLHPDAKPVDVANGGGGRYYDVGGKTYQVGPNGASEGFLSAGPKGDPGAYWGATKPEVPWKPPPPP